MSGQSIAIILGRRDSSGFPGKNTMSVLGHPLMWYALMAARDSKFISQTFVTTDDPAIKEIALEAGATVIDRPPELCTDDALFDDALEHGYHEAKNILGAAPKYVAVLMCNSPMISADLIDEGISKLNADDTADSAVTTSIYNMWSPLRARKLNESGYLDPFVPFETFGDPATLSCDRDSQGDVYYADMGVTVSRSSALEHMSEGLLPQKWMGQKILPIENWAGMDIDYAWQIPIAEYWLREHGVGNVS
ncbi:MAG: cytidylyltransferase [Chloroflexi bacterium]|jgi:CMP-N-acetylneuraminic acid synthetase|nr:cytidylyltransferase [Chloroflexota bacterium]